MGFFSQRMKNMKFKDTYIKLGALVLLLTLCLQLFSFNILSWTGNGILNNGYDGISINIYAQPYTTYAKKSYGQFAYGPSGCAWFASSRACELTGIDTPIWSGQNWYDSAYSYYGYTRGSTPVAKALACYPNHVAVVEAVYGDTIVISEGGNTSYPNNDYCVIRTRTRAQVESDGFLGYVYLEVGGGSSAMVTFGNFYGFIQNHYANMVLTTDTKGGWGNVYMSPYTGAKRQLWYFQQDDGGYYSIYSLYDNTCLDVGNAETGNGANLTSNQYSGHNAQKFYFTGSEGSYTIHTKLCGTVVDIPGNSAPYDGINVQMWTPTNSANQQFVLYEVKNPYPGLKEYGDITMDDKVNASDALAILRHTVNKAPLDVIFHDIADVDANGKINAVDALQILKKAVGKLDKFPAAY